MYAWDVFVSYPQAGKIPGWVTGVFVPQLKAELGALGIKPPRVFVDSTGLTSGDWPVHLQEAHQSARMFVAVLAAPYFQSGWCLAEWANAFERERLAWGAGHTRELVVPIVFNDCTEPHLDKLPPILRDQVRGRTRTSFESYTSLIDPNEPVTDAYAFRKAMAQLCEGRIAPAIQGSPPFQPGWPTLPTAPISGADPSWFPELAR
jgi:hypothetical protein